MKYVNVSIEEIIGAVKAPAFYTHLG